MTLAWRGEDDRGSFAQRITVAAPARIPVESTWTLVAATRTGLLYAIDGEVDVGDEVPAMVRASLGLYWFGAAGAHAVTLDGHREPLGRGTSLALADGGALVLVPQNPDGSDRYFTTALRLSPEGVVLGHLHIVDARVIGFGEAGEHLGLVTHDGDHLTLRTVEGDAIPFGRWRVDELPHVCGEPRSAVTRLHVVQRREAEAPDGEYETPLSVTVGPGFDAPDFASVRLLTLERPLGGEMLPCVRRAWGMHALEYEVDDGDDDYAERLWGAFRLTARGGRFVGVYDSGARIGRSTFRIEARRSDPYGMGMDI